MIAIIDYGAGNLFSVKNALDYLQIENCVTEKAEIIRRADGLILPGVGAFPDAMERLERKQLVSVIQEEAARKPLLGICLGMQMAVVEFARHVLGWADANSAEFSETTRHPVIALMPDQMHITDKGGTMRLGKYPCVLAENTRSRALYGTAEISERHRHRFEFQNDCRSEMQEQGMVLAGLSPDGRLVEIVELSQHPWFVGAQFHPEFKSRPDRPHPLFYGFVKAALEQMQGKENMDESL